MFIIAAGKPLGATATNAIFELVYQIGSTCDSHLADRITMLLNWLTDVATVSLQVRIIIHCG